MLRNRSRAVTGKQALMADVRNPFFGSPRFKPFAAKTDHSLISPTSVLDSKPFFSLQKPFFYDPKPTPNPPKNPIFSGNKQKISHPNPIGLALIEDKNDSNPSKSVIFGAKLRVLIPPDSAVGGGSGLMTVKEMEVCEEYTCVKRHGPNAKTTHIFDNFVVKSLVDYDSQKISMAEVKNKNKNKNNHFLEFCFTCNTHLHLSNDIYIYRGEKAFCSHECRYQEMLLDEEDEDSF